MSAKYLMLFSAGIVIFFFYWCQEKKISFIVVNKSDQEIDSVLIRSYLINEVFTKVKSQDSIERKISFSTPPGKGEGGFSISIFKNNSLVYSDIFGFYPNKAFVKDVYKIVIDNGFLIKITTPP